MASNIVENEDGTFIRDPAQGVWRKASRAELEELEKGGLQVAGESFVNNFASLGNIAALPFAGRAPGGFSTIMENLSALGQEQQLRSRMNEGATAAGTAGAMVLDPLNLVALPVSRAGGTMARRVAARAAAGADQLSMRTTGGARPSPLMQTAAEQSGRSVGAAEVARPKGMRGLLDLVFEPGELTPQQRALIPVGERVGFQFMPGQKDGNRLFLDSLQSHPVTSQAFAYELGTNADTLRTLVMQAMQLPGGGNPGNFTREILRLSRQAIGQRFDRVRSMIPEGRTIGLEADDIALLDESKVLKPGQRRSIDLNSMTPDQVFEVRSRLNRRLSDYYRAGEKTAGDDLAEVVERLDNAIGENIGPEGMELWRTARMQWRVRLATKQPGVITPDGDVSLKRLAASLEKQFEREFGETLVPDEAFRAANPAIADLLDFTRVARSFASNLPDSGTATRQTIGRILSGNYTEVAAAATVRALVEGTALLR